MPPSSSRWPFEQPEPLADALREQGAFRGLGVPECMLEQRRVDLGQHLPFAHRIAELHFQRFQLPRDLSADIDLPVRVQRADREHGILEIGPLDACRQIRWRFVRRKVPVTGDSNNQSGERARAGQ